MSAGSPPGPESDALHRLWSVLRAVDADHQQSPRETAEIAWLALRLHERTVADPAPSARPPRRSPRTEPVSPTPVASPETAEPDRRPLYLPPTAPAAQETPAEEALPVARPRPASPVRLDSPRGLAAELPLLRALRPLKRRSPSPRVQVDEDASAEYIAEHGHWMPVLRPVPDRWLRALVVVDVHTEARDFWLPLAQETHQMLVRLGAFSSVQLLHLHVSQDGAVGLSHAPSETGRLRSTASTLDATGRTLTLVMTDGVGTAWRHRPLREALLQWARSGPTAVLQLLPERLWNRLALAPVPAQLRSTAPGAPNTSALYTGYRGRHRTLGEGEVAVPVLEISSSWLAPWARFVAGATAIDIATVITSGELAPGPAPGSSAGSLEAFRATAQPAVFRLAAYLATVPLSLPVMRIVQAATMPAAPPSALPEIIFSGLLVRVPSAPAQDGPLTTVYDFRPGVRQALLRTLRKDEADTVRAAVSSYIDEHAGPAGPRFTSLVPDEDGSVELPGTTENWAVAPRRVLRRIGENLLATVTGLQWLSVPDSGEPAPQSPHIPPPNLPAATRYFTGRTDESLRIHAALYPPRTGLMRRRASPARVCVIQGPNGVGKTALALDYARSQLDRHRFTWWLRAGRADLVELAAAVGIPDHDSYDVMLTRLRGWLAVHPGWLLVYDNADPADPVIGELREQLEAGDGRLLITSNHTGWAGAGVEIIELDRWPEDEGLAYLHRRLQIDDEEEAIGYRLLELGERLGWLPLALEQAAAYIRQADISVEEYLRALRPDTPVANLFQRAIERVAQQSSTAVDLLRLCAHLGSEDIPRSALAQHAAVLPHRLQQTVNDPTAFHTDVLLLVDHSLLQRSGEARLGTAVLGVHPRIQHLAISQLDVDGRLEWSQAAVRFVEALFPDRPEALDERSACERLMPHAAAVLDHVAWGDEPNGGFGASVDPGALVRLLHRVGTYAQTRGEWALALALFEREAALRELGDEDLLLRAAALVAVGRQHYYLAHLGPAERGCRNAMELCEHLDDESNVQLLRARTFRLLSGIMREQSQFEQALFTAQQAIVLYDQQDPRIYMLERAVTELEAGLVHRDRGNPAQAAVSYERAWDLSTRRGSGDFREQVVFRAMIRRERGVVAQDRGDLITADSELSAALGVFRENRGTDDYETAHLAVLLADVRRTRSDQLSVQARQSLNPLRIRELRREARSLLESAAALLEPAITLHRAHRGMAAQRYTACLTALGSLLLSQGEPDDARAVLEEVIELYTATYGPRHRYTAEALVRLGPVLRATGNPEAAERTLRRAEGILKQVLGSSHPALVPLYGHLADCFDGRGARNEAAVLRSDADLILQSLKAAPSLLPDPPPRGMPKPP
ncbi:SAV_2336 N-terminal domain-related protein [Streptomyces sp. NPDC056468]|uniref:SAV_2336 N-terminal domain-related protein n=1 Tax=Streptomyces sp. NPDC056468 TaxID=3345830 RepID=UPI0036CC8CC9